MTLEQHNEKQTEITELKKAANKQAAIMHLTQNDVVVKVDNTNYIILSIF
jgi:hypothetical protein